VTKRKVKQQEEAPPEPTTLDRINAAADRNFVEAFASVPEQIADYLNDQLDAPEVPELPKVEPEAEDVDVD